MDKDDVKRLFRLLRTVYPNAKQFSDPIALEAWAQVLEPCTYEDVKTAALEHMRSKRFPPDVTELTSALDIEPAQEFCLNTADVDKATSRMLERIKPFRDRCHAYGIPTPAEAKLQGISFAEWKSMAEVANGD